MNQSRGRIAILTDSSCDLPQQYFKKYTIYRLPLIVTCGETAYRDGVEITADGGAPASDWGCWRSRQPSMPWPA